MIHAIVYLVLWIGVGLANAAEFCGRVVSIADGDTITLLDRENKQHRIRLSGIDAPERGQPFSDRSRENLSRLLRGQEARADCHKVDQYRRQVCVVWVRPPDCQGCDATLDVGAAQIDAGMAWWYRQYAREQSAGDRAQYEAAERDARDAKRGLWSDRESVPPWEWRTANRNR